MLTRDEMSFMELVHTISRLEKIAQYVTVMRDLLGNYPVETFHLAYLQKH
jgi:hypothetical protein